MTINLIFFRTTAPPAFGTGSISFGTPGTQAQATFGVPTTQTQTAFGGPATQTAFGGPATQTAFGTPAIQTHPSFGLNVAQTALPATGGFQLGTTAIATSTTPSLFGTQPTLNFNKPTGFAAPTAQTGLFGTTSTTTTGGLQIGKNNVEKYS